MKRREAQLVQPSERYAPGETAGQDVNDQRWYSDALPDGSMTFGETGHAHEGVRTLSNVVDLGLEIVDDIEHAFEHDGGKHEHEHEAMRVLPVQSVAADSFRADTVTATPNGIKLVDKRDDRMRLVVTNLGPGTVYISHGNTPSTGQGVYPLAVNQTQEFRTRAEMWAIAAAGQNPAVAFIDEFGYVSSC